MTTEKYAELIKEIAGIISDGERECVLLKYELERTKKALDEAEAKIIELVAENAALMMIDKEAARNA